MSRNLKRIRVTSFIIAYTYIFVSLNEAAKTAILKYFRENPKDRLAFKGDYQHTRYISTSQNTSILFKPCFLLHNKRGKRIIFFPSRATPRVKKNNISVMKCGNRRRNVLHQKRRNSLSKRWSKKIQNPFFILLSFVQNKGMLRSSREVRRMEQRCHSNQNWSKRKYPLITAILFFPRFFLRNSRLF